MSCVSFLPASDISSVSNVVYKSIGDFIDDISSKRALKEFHPKRAGVVATAAVVTSVAAYCVNSSIVRLASWVVYAEEVVARFGLSSWTARVGGRVALVCCARLAMLLAPAAKGSGIPEIKCMLNGTKMEGILNLRVLFAKAIGLVFAIAGGLPLGKEGPFVHMAACAVSVAKDLPVFRSPFWVADYEHLRVQLVLAAVSIGVGITFNAPIGGVLFGLELMLPHLVDASLYKACFSGATISSLAYMTMITIFGGDLTPLSIPDARKVPDLDISIVPLCFLTGAACGWLAAVWVGTQARALAAVRRLQDACYKAVAAAQARASGLLGLTSNGLLPQAANGALKHGGHSQGVILSVDLLLCAAVACLSALPALLDARIDRSVIKCVCDMAGIAHEWLLPELAVLFVAYFILSALALTLPVPTGAAVPLLLLGAILGRIAGEVFPEFRATLTIVGMASFAAAACRTYSLVIILFEVLALSDGEVKAMILATMVSMAVAERMSLSTYDTVLVQKKLPCLPQTAVSASRMLKFAEDLMSTDLQDYTLPRKCQAASFAEQLDAAAALPRRWFCIVEDLGGQLVALGAVRSEVLSKLSGLPSPKALQNESAIDVLEIAVARDVLEPLAQIRPKDLLIDVYLCAQTKHCGGQVFVVEAGRLLGVITRERLLEAAMAF